MVPPLWSQMLHLVVSLTFSLALCQVTALNSSSLACDGVSKDSILVGLPPLFSRYSWILMMLQMSTLKKMTAPKIVTMINLALSTQKPVSPLASYHPRQVRQVTGSVLKSHQSQRQTSHTGAGSSQIARESKSNNITLYIICYTNVRLRIYELQERSIAFE